MITTVIFGLSNYKISSKGVMTIAGMLQINNTLQHIDLEYNKFSSDDLIQILVTIKDNTTLRVMGVESELQQKPVKRQLSCLHYLIKEEEIHSKWTCFI